METLNKYIGTHIVVPGKDSIPVLIKVIGRRRHQSINLVSNLNNNPILDTIDGNYLFSIIMKYL